MKKRLAKFAGSILAAAALAWLGGLLWFASTIPETVADTATPTDAIVVLTGGSERIETGVRLLDAGLAERMFVSGVGGQAKAADILTRGQGPEPVKSDKISVGTSASNTPENAVETAAWVRNSNVHSIRLVTAGYHMRRSLLEFHAAMPEVTIVPHAVFPPNVKSDWWRWPGTASLIAREYSKFVVTWTLLNVAAVADRGVSRGAAAAGTAR